MATITYALSKPNIGEYGMLSQRYVDELQSYFYLWAGRDYSGNYYDDTWRLDPKQPSNGWEIVSTPADTKATAFMASELHTDTQGDARPTSVGGLFSTSNSSSDAEPHEFIEALRNPLSDSPSWVQTTEAAADFQDAADYEYKGTMRMINGTKVNDDGTAGSIQKQHYEVTGCPSLSGNPGSCSGFSLSQLGHEPNTVSSGSEAVASDTHETILMTGGFDDSDGLTTIWYWSNDLGGWGNHDPGSSYHSDYQRSNHSIIRIGNRVILFGGQIEDSSSPNAFKLDHSIMEFYITEWPDEGTLGALSTQTNIIWPRIEDDNNYNKAKDYPYQPRKRGKVALINDEIWWIGGVDDNFTAIDSVDKFELDSNGNLQHIGTAPTLPDSRFGQGSAFVN